MRSLGTFSPPLILLILSISLVSSDILGWEHITKEDYVLNPSQFLVIDMSNSHGLLRMTINLDDNDWAPLNILIMDSTEFDTWKEYGQMSDNCLLSSPPPTTAFDRTYECPTGTAIFRCDLSYFQSRHCGPTIEWKGGLSVSHDFTWDDKPADWKLVIYSPDRKKVRFSSYSFDIDPDRRYRWMFGAGALLFSCNTMSAFLLIVATVFGGLYIWRSHKRRLRIHQLGNSGSRGRKRSKQSLNIDSDTTPLLS
ncbi:hypothetical protein PROFUN_00065 [Planoprotostelium fungivorum]|uniref:Uncharacterized protein n=1 Tax=Planoprotostelium fungivorum TaxID=1890364 RepID=A0A2P6P0J1_9EUKA|nr:hypothetical protein PROFUN_00065 [Planoprotostelium fungivorum]